MAGGQMQSLVMEQFGIMIIIGQKGLLMMRMHTQMEL